MSDTPCSTCGWLPREMLDHTAYAHALVRALKAERDEAREANGYNFRLITKIRKQRDQANVLLEELAQRSDATRKRIDAAREATK